MDDNKPLSKNIYFGREVVEYLEGRAKRMDRSVSWIVKRLVEEEMERERVRLLSVVSELTASK